MSSYQSNSSESRVECQLGFARINLRKLDFERAKREEHREEDENAKKTLFNVFKLAGCHRLKQEHFIDALIDEDTFDLALRDANLQRDTFLTLSQGLLKIPEGDRKPEHIPILNPEHNVHCMNGLHRTSAAKIYLDNNDQWWVVRLHLKEGFTKRQRIDRYEAFAHEQSYSDGTIFRNIRLYNRKGDKENEDKWWAHLSAGKAKDLRQLLRNHDIKQAFDDLIDFPGLWPPMQLGQLHRTNTMRVPENLVNGLHHIRDIYRKIVPVHFQGCVCTLTVRYLESLAPGVSSQDADRVTRLMQKGTIFPDVKGPHERHEILQEILAIKSLIPSLRTFFENQKYLEPCTFIFKKLLGPGEKRSIWRGFCANYFEPQQTKVQRTESVDLLTTLPVDDGDENTGVAKKLAYLQLWMFCFRHWPDMTLFNPRLRIRKENIRKKQNNYMLWARLGRLAVHLGFKTPETERLSKLEEDREDTEQFVKSMRPCFVGDRNPHILQIQNVLSGMVEESHRISDLLFTDGDPCIIRDRCGTPFNDDQQLDKQSLFASLFYLDIQRGFNISTLFIKRDIILSFLSSYIVQLTGDAQSVLLSPVDATHRDSQNGTRQIESEAQTLRINNDRLKEDIEKLRQEMQDNRETWYGKETQLNAEIAECRRAAQERDQYLSGCKQHITELELALQNSQASQGELHREASDVRSKMETRDKDLTSLNEKLCQLDCEVKMSRDLVYQRDAAIKTQVSEIQSLRERETSMKDSNLQLKKGAEELQSRIVNLEEDVKCLHVKLAESNATIETQSNSSVGNQAQVLYLNSQIEFMKMQHNVQIEEKDFQILQKDSQIKEKDLQLEQKDLQIIEKDFQIGQKDSQIQACDQKLADWNRQDTQVTDLDFHRHQAMVIEDKMNIPRIFDLQIEKERRDDIDYFMNKIHCPKGYIPVYFLDLREGIRSILLKIPNDNIDNASVARLLSEFEEPSWSVYITKTCANGDISHRRMTSFDVQSFLETCQGEERVIVGTNRDIEAFFKERSRKRGGPPLASEILKRLRKNAQ